MTEPLDLRAKGWLNRLLGAYLAAYDPDQARQAVASMLTDLAGAPPDLQSHHLALRRLEGIGLRPCRLAICPSLVEALGDDLAREDLEAIGLLTTQWDILQDIAWLHRNESGPLESQLELLTIMSLGLKDYSLAHELHRAHLEEVAGEEVDVAVLAVLAERVETRLAPKGKMLHSQAALSIGIGLAYIEARVLARIASLYYERSAIEEEGIDRLHELSKAEKVDLVEVLVYLAWADGKIAKEERLLIEHQVSLADLDEATSKRLLDRLDAQPRDALDLSPLEAGARRFILEQAILLSLVDDDQAEAELALLGEVARQLGGTEQELEEIMVGVAAFYERNRLLIRDFGPVSGSLGRLRRLVVDRVAGAIRSNLGKLVQEIKETGELAVLLGAASVRELTDEESTKVKSQLIDICKTVPALAVFLLPGGALVLPVLIKLLPFNLMPTAFSDAPDPKPPPPEFPPTRQYPAVS